MYSYGWIIFHVYCDCDVSRIVEQPNGGTRKVSCYQLTKTECLYIATKFNDEAFNGM